MSARIIDGKSVAANLRADIAKAVKAFENQAGRVPGLAVVLVGEDPASKVYVRNKGEQTVEVGMRSIEHKLDASTPEAELLDLVRTLNKDPDVDGILVQFPVPDQISQQTVIDTIDPAKDVDGFCPANVGNMCLGLPTYVSATPNGIMELLSRYEIETEGKNCVVLGRSNIVGTPMAILLSRNTAPGNCTVTLLHSRSRDIAAHCRAADILIAAIGRPNYVGADMVKPGAVVIDVGITRIADDSRKNGFRLVGDVDFEAVSDKCSFITPVPGGVGPMTRASLLQNTLKACQRKS